VDKVGVLCEKDRAMLAEFSRQSLDRASGHARVLLSLPFFSAYYDANVRKEVDKDRLIIEEAARAFEAGRPVCDLDLEDIFEKTKTVDKAFVDNLLIPSLSLIVQYGDIADIRIQRIRRIARAVYDLLEKWPDTAAFDDVVRSVYRENDFKELIRDILRLYNQETMMLSHSIKLLPPLNRAMSSFSETLFQAMEETATVMADACAHKLFGDKNVYA